MIIRLIWRIRRERGDVQTSGRPGGRAVSSDVLLHGIPVTFGAGHLSPAVRGVFHPRILLPTGIDRLLDQREFNAVLLHEVAHAQRRDNLMRLLYEISLCVLWFHPLVWLAGARMALYRELSCDESVIRRAHGVALVSALAKLAAPEQTAFLHASASSHLSYRLARLTCQAESTQRAASLLLTFLFVVVLAGGIFQTIAHTACCFLLKR
jgi:beta-lactamase regulating signal transducer with metallopeptidase domain